MGIKDEENWIFKAFYVDGIEGKINSSGNRQVAPGLREFRLNNLSRLRHSKPVKVSGYNEEDIPLKTNDLSKIIGIVKDPFYLGYTYVDDSTGELIMIGIGLGDLVHSKTPYIASYLNIDTKEPGPEFREYLEATTREMCHEFNKGIYLGMTLNEYFSELALDIMEEYSIPSKGIIPENGGLLVFPQQRKPHKFIAVFAMINNFPVFCPYNTVIAWL